MIRHVIVIVNAWLCDCHCLCHCHHCVIVIVFIIVISIVIDCDDQAREGGEEGAGWQNGQALLAENDAMKKNLDDVNEWIRVENAKRQKEVEELRELMEREKKELQEFIDADNKRMADKINAENEERQRQEEEMRKRLAEAQDASEQGTIQLYKKMQGENLAR